MGCPKLWKHILLAGEQNQCQNLIEKLDLKMPLCPQGWSGIEKNGIVTAQCNKGEGSSQCINL